MINTREKRYRSYCQISVTREIPYGATCRVVAFLFLFTAPPRLNNVTLITEIPPFASVRELSTCLNSTNQRYHIHHTDFSQNHTST